MICPECNGSGRIRKRFLLLFHRRARCPRCLGTGEYPPPVGDVVRYRTRYRDDDDDRDRWPAVGYSVPSSDARPRDDDRFEVGSGGRSGGGGASASWGDAPAGEPPVIADPFAGDSSGASGAAIADASYSDSSSSAGDSSSEASSGGSGTSY